MAYSKNEKKLKAFLSKIEKKDDVIRPSKKAKNNTGRASND